MSACIRIVSSAAAFVAGVVFGVQPSYAQEKQASPEVASAIASAPNLAGRWKLDPDKSDDARKKMREAGEGRRGGGPGGGMGGPPGGGRGGPPGAARGGGRGPGGGFGPGADDAREFMRTVLEPAAELLITPTENEIVILEKDGRLRTLHPDGKKYKSEGGNTEVKTRWEGAQLVVETRTEMGGRTTETFVLSGNKPAASAPADPRTLTITVQLEGTPMPAMSLRRVYQLTELSAE